MSFRFADSFDYYSTSDITRKWTSNDNGAISSVQKRNGPNSLRFNAAQDSVNKAFDSQASWVFGFGYWVTSSFGADKRLLALKDSATTQCTLLHKVSGTLAVVRSTGTAVTNGESILTLNSGTWYYIEFKVTIANSISAGSCKVRVNGVEWLTVATGQDLQITGNATADRFDLGNITNNAGGLPIYFDDLYVLDGQSGLNDFLGDSRVAALHPDGNGNTNDFTGQDADSVNNHLNVDETDTDDDSTYNESSTVGHKDLHTFDNMPTSPDSIHAVQVNNIVKKDDAGDRTIRAMTRPTVANFFGASKAPSNGSYVNEAEIWEDNPQTAAAWTESTLNASEFGIEIET